MTLFFNKRLFLACLLTFCGISSFVLAQSNANSPYSIFGIGDMVHPTNVNSLGMGGIGLSFTNQLNVNTLNPALLSRNNTNTIFDAGSIFERKILTNNKGQQRDFGGNLSYMAFVFPLSKRSGMGLGLQPVSKINYQFFSLEKSPDANSFTQYAYLGSGGITQLYLSAGYRIWKGFSLGLQGAYNFGIVKRQAESLVDEPGSIYTVERLRRYNFGAFSGKMGLSYRQKLKEKVYLAFGAVHEFKTSLNASYLYALQRKSASTGLTLISDTLTQDGSKSLKMPASNSLGISLEKTLNYAVGIDFKMHDWSSFDGFDGRDTLKAGYALRVGGEWTPKFTATTGYFKRVTYRLGFCHNLMPIVLNGSQLIDQSLSFGLSLPVIKPTDLYHSFSRINMAFVLGQRGTTDNGLIREQYWRIHLGLNINQMWFLRRKYD